MKRFDTNIGSRDAALQQAPEVFEAVSVNLPVNVSFRMIHDLVGVFSGQSVIGCQSVGVQCRSDCDMLFNRGMKSGTLAICDYSSANPSPRSSAPNTTALSCPPVPVMRRFLTSKCMFLALPPMKVSSTST